VVVTKEAIAVLNHRMVDRGFETEEECEEAIAQAVEYSYSEAMINGIIYNDFIPPKDYDGGKLDYLYYDELTFDNKEEYFDWLLDYYLKEQNPVRSEAERYIETTKAVFDAIINRTYTEMPDRYESFEHVSIMADPLADLRFTWEYDKAALENIKDRIEEYSVYDEQLGMEFIVHVTLPLHYDSTETYPVLFLTDAVWRLNDHAALYKAMERGEAADVILVSLGCNYNIKNADNFVRFELLISNRKGLLDFVTDDLMPYLCENYNIDCDNSTLFGHSMAGVFSHYALYNSDKYENQPFGRYIIGSPALFNLYDYYTDLGAEDAVNDYGYFDRNASLDKKVFLCGGELEDPDYKDQYQGHDSTLEGLKKINDRLEAHNADVTYKLYESHHYQYVPDMLLEYLLKEYPAH
jgi:predicted alpha/beta superfamily hydrolase